MMRNIAVLACLVPVWLAPANDLLVLLGVILKYSCDSVSEQQLRLA